MGTRWSLGVLIGLPIAALCLAVAIAMIVGGVLHRRAIKGSSADHDAVGRDGLWMLGTLAAIVTLVITGFAMFPFSGEYHQWRPTSGTVDAVNSRILGDSNSVSQRFVLRFTSGDERACDDTRCSLIKVGDQVDLSCKRHYQWTGTPGWDCNFVGSTK